MVTADAYYGTRLSEHISRTPEGFLIAHDTPLCRTAERVPMVYRGSEVGLATNDTVEVYRSAAEVLSKKHLASIEGKPVVAGHPSQFVNADNASWAAKGHVQNVRPGPELPDGEQCVIGDIVITDSTLANQVVSGQLREVSLGYACEYTPRGDGTFAQKKLRVNHIAVVESGRCGSACRINDSAVLVGDFVEMARKYHRKNASAVAAERAEERATDRLPESLRRGDALSWDELSEIHRQLGEEAMTRNHDEDLITEDEREVLERVLARLEGQLSERRTEDAEESLEERALAHLRAIRPVIERTGDLKAIDAYNNAVRAIKHQQRNRAVVSDCGAPGVVSDAVQRLFGGHRFLDTTNTDDPDIAFELMARRAGARMRGEKVEAACSERSALRAHDGSEESYETVIARRRRELLGR